MGFKRIATLAILMALCVTAGMYAQQNRAASVTGAKVTNDVLHRTGAATDAMPGSWLSYGKTQNETRYSPLKQIDVTNAKRMGLAWSYVMGAGGGNQEGTPL